MFRQPPHPETKRLSLIQPWQGYIGHDAVEGQPMYWWSINRLWHLSAGLPFSDEPLESFQHVLDEMPTQPATKREMALLVRRIMNADLSYPVILHSDGSLLDGSHRLMKAYATEEATIRTVRFAIIPEPDYIASAEEMERTSWHLGFEMQSLEKLERAEHHA